MKANMTEKEVTIRYEVYDRKGCRVTKEKTFKSKKAMQKWAAAQEGNDNWGGITAFSDEF